MQFQSNIKRNYLFSSAYQILLVISPLITTPYIARVFGASGAGAYTMANTVAFYFLKFANVGVSVYGNRNIAYVRDDEKELYRVFTEIFLAQSVFSAFSLINYSVYAFFSPIGEKLLVRLNFLYVLSAFFDISWLYYGIEKIDVTVKINATIKVINIICVFAFVRNQKDIGKYTFIMCMGFLLNTFLAWINGFRYIKFQKVQVRNVIRRMAPILVLFIPVMASSVYKSMDKLMLGVITGSDEIVGLYNNSEQLIGVPQGIITSIGVVMLPRISNMLATGKQEKAVQEMRITMRFINFLAIAVSFGIAAIAPEFVPLFLGNSFNKCIYYIIMLAPCNLFISWGYSIRNQYLIPWKRDKVYISSIISGAIINFCINILLIPQIGIVGAIIGTLVAEFAVAGWQSFSIRREIETKKYLLDAIPFVPIGTFMALLVRVIGRHMGIHIYTVFVEIIAGSIFYIVTTVIFLYVFERDTLKIIIRFIKK